MSRKERRKLAKIADKEGAKGKTQGGAGGQAGASLERLFGEQVAHFDAGRLKEAEAGLSEILRRRPDVPEALHLLALIELRTDRAEAAAGHLEKAIALLPGSADLHNLLGGALKELRRLDDAMAAYRRAIDINPGHVEAHVNLGAAFHDSCRLDEARESFRRALDIDPGYAAAHENLGMTLLLDGRLEEGWAEYAWRSGKDVFLSGGRVLDRPFWDGGTFDSQTLLLFAGQGLGDTIQFLRYLPMAAKKGGEVIVQCPAPLIRLFEAAPAAKDIYLVTEIGDAPLDLQAPLHSLPGIFATTLDTIPADVPYLAAEDERVGDWRDRIGGNGFRVGINWQGDPTYRADRNRSVPLRFFEPLAKAPGVRLISLQKVNGLEQLETLPKGMTVETLGDDFDEGEDAFIDTSAVMMLLDLIITSDTAIAYLAGALGAPVWTLLPWVPDWRWLLDRDDSPWYPTMRLFRQPAAGDWDAVFGEVGQALGRLAKGNP
ncbi:MAG: tetratricopeptide repeat protein [Proteobacteria bacterium]|nr:tetratricopeptide repeat protein [Pseudomonadota bacterium]